MINPPGHPLWNNQYFNYDVAVSNLPTFQSSPPGHGSVTNLNSNSDQSATQNNSLVSHGNHNNLVGHGNHKVGGVFGLESLISSPGLLNGIMCCGDVTNSCSEQHQPNHNHLPHQPVAAGSWAVSLEEQQQQMRHFQDQPSSLLQSANLKHKFASSSSGGVLGKPAGGGSCMASLEQALFHPGVRHVSSSQRGASLPPSLPPVESAGKLLSDFQAQFFSQQVVQQNQQNRNLLLMQSPGSETGTSSPHMSGAAPLMDTLNSSSSSEVQWRGSSSPGSSRRFLPVEPVKGLTAAEVSIIADNLSNKNLACCPSEADSQSHGQNIMTSTAYDHFSDFLIPAEPLPLTDHHQLPTPPGRTPSNNHSWSSEVSPTLTTTSEREQEAEGGFRLWEDNDTVPENRRFLNCSRKRVRGDIEANSSHQSDANPEILNNQSSHILSLEGNRCLEEEKKYQVLKAMVQNKSSSKFDRAAVLDNIIELVEELQRKVKESESTTASSASDDGQKPSHLERTSSLTTSLVQGGNRAKLRRAYNDQVLQLQYSGGKGGKAGSSNSSLLRLSDVCLDNEDGLDGVVLSVVDGIPQIEVRMMENEQVMIKLSCKDRPGLFTDIISAFEDLHLQVQHANIRTVSGLVHDVFAAKVDVSLAEKQRTSDIAEAIRRAIQKGTTPNSYSTTPATPDANPNINSPLERSL